MTVTNAFLRRQKTVIFLFLLKSFKKLKKQMIMEKIKYFQKETDSKQ